MQLQVAIYFLPAEWADLSRYRTVSTASQLGGRMPKLVEVQAKPIPCRFFQTWMGRGVKQTERHLTRLLVEQNRVKHIYSVWQPAMFDHPVLDSTQDNAHSQ